MFQEAGFSLDLQASARRVMPEATTQHIDALRPAARMFGVDDKSLEMNLSAYQWIVRGRRTDVNRSA